MINGDIEYQLKNLIRAIVDQRLSQQGTARHGTVKSVDPVNALVKVSYDETDEAVSGWLPIVQTAVGNGWGAVCLPLPGTQVFVHPDMGDITHGVVGGRRAFDATAAGDNLAGAGGVHAAAFQMARRSA